jgi:hypothetical protein
MGDPQALDAEAVALAVTVTVAGIDAQRRTRDGHRNGLGYPGECDRSPGWDRQNP